jgi:hypothetical protein
MVVIPPLLPPDRDGEVEEIKDEIVEKFVRTFSNGDYDAELDDALMCPVRSVPLPPAPTQASYNKPEDWVERNRTGLTKLKRQLQTHINSARHSTMFHLRLTHNTYAPWEPRAENEEQIVWHEPVLQEYWDQLVTGIDQTEINRRTQLGMVTDIIGIHIQNVEMTKECMAALVDIFCSERTANSSRDVSLVNVNLCEEGIICLSKLIDVSFHLHELQLKHNRIDSMKSAHSLSRSIKSHIGINFLNLAHCDLGSNPNILSVMLQSDIRKIVLNNNNIDSLGAVKIAEYLEGDPPIHSIDLSHNRLNDDDATLISQALKRNTMLKIIHLHSNKITSIGVKALLTCVFDSSSLNAISESNHTLNQLMMFSRGSRLYGCIDRLLELDQFQKIVLVLQDKDSLLKYLANIPVELIPEVLAFPRGRIVDESQHKYLNIIYSTMRWWNMPMLYSYHQCVMTDAKRKRID